MVSFEKMGHEASIYPLGHSVEVDEQAQKNLVRRRTVLVDPAEIAENGDTGHILAVEGQDTRRLLTQARGTFRGWYLAMEMIVLAVVCGCNFGQQACHHLNDVRDGHLADLILGPNVRRVPTLPAREGAHLREGASIVNGEALDVGQAFDLDPHR